MAFIKQRGKANNTFAVYYSVKQIDGTWKKISVGGNKSRKREEMSDEKRPEK